MPGPVSDSYDPVFSTTENRDIVKQRATLIDKKVTRLLKGAEPKYIVSVAQTRNQGPPITATLRENEWRMVRFALRVVQGSEDY